MGRTWKFTEQIYQEISEAVNYKITMYFCSRLFGELDSPFETYEDEIDMGISKLNGYVEMINEADGYDKAKLDRVFGQIAETDRSYGNQIQECTDDIVRYKNVLYQVEEVMRQAMAGSSNGNVNFNFDKETFRSLVIEDKNAMDIAYVDRILAQDASEITQEEYEMIAVLIGNQTAEDTTLVEYILNSAYCWEFVDHITMEGYDITPEMEGQPSFGAFMPTEKYWRIMEALSVYAANLSINEPENSQGTPYKELMNNVIRYEQLFSQLTVNCNEDTWNYLIGQEGEMVNAYLGNRVQLKRGETSIGEDGEVYSGLLVTVEGMTGPTGFEIIGPFAPDGAINALAQLQNTYINEYLQLDMTDGEVVVQSIGNSIFEQIGNSAISEAIMDALLISEGQASGSVWVAGTVIGAVDDVNEHHQMEETITEYENIGTQASTINVLGLNCGIINVTQSYDGKDKEVITVYPGRETLERIDKLNEFLQGEGATVLKSDTLELIPEGGLKLEYVVNHLEETDVLFGIVERDIMSQGYANSLVDALGLE